MVENQRTEVSAQRKPFQTPEMQQEHLKHQWKLHVHQQIWRKRAKFLCSIVEHNSHEGEMNSELNFKIMRRPWGGKWIRDCCKYFKPGPSLIKAENLMRVLLISHLLARCIVTATVSQTNHSMASATVPQQMGMGVGVGVGATSTIMQGLSLAIGVSSSSLITRAEQALHSTYHDKRLLSMAASNVSKMPDEVPTHTSVHNILKILNSKSRLKAAPEGRNNRTNHNERPPQDSFVFPAFSTYKKQCQSCQMLEKVKQDNLESIKMQILMRLQMSQLPNITAPISVPQNILDKFYRSYNMSKGQKQPIGHSHRKESNNRTNMNQADGQYMRQQSSRTTKATKTNSAKKPSTVDSRDRGKEFSVYNHNNEEDATGDDGMQNDDPQIYENPSRQPPGEIFNYNRVHNDNIDDSYIDMNTDNFNSDDDEYYEHTYDDFYEQDDFFPRTNSYYVFPTSTHVRHYRKTEVLNFKFENSHSKILRCILHIYVRGRSWIRENDPSVLEHTNTENISKGGDRHYYHPQEIVLSVHRANANAFNFTNTTNLTNAVLKIPPGSGQWKQIEVTPMALHWMKNPNATQCILIKVAESWMRPLIVTSGGAHQNPLIAHLELITQESRRLKRSTSLDCQENDQEVRCCRYPLKVNFTNFGWHFVVAPTSFDAYFCNGECKVGYLEQYTHTHITSLTTSATPCCSPTKMSPLSLLYFNLDQILVLSTIPNMSVEKCSCS